MQPCPRPLFAAGALIALGAFDLPAEQPFVLADFEKEAVTNVGGEISARQRVPSSVKWALDPEHNASGSPGQSLRVEYIRLSGGEQCHLILRIPGIDTSAYDALSFWVKGSEGGELFDVTLRDAGEDGREQIPDDTVPVEKALTGGVTTDWQKAVIPLAELRRGAAKPASIVIVFSRITKYSLIHLDDFRLEKNGR